MVEFAPADADGLFSMGFAGDTFNTAWYLKKCLSHHAEVEFLTAVGTDRVSDQMIGFLKDASIGVAHIARRSDRTVGLYLIQLDKGERSFSYWRGASAARTLAADDIDLTGALTGATMAYFSGITLAILSQKDRNRLLQSLREFRAGGGTVVFDTNLRPRLWGTPDDMKGAVMQAASISDIILPSFDDEANWFGDKAPQDTAYRYAEGQARIVVVKNGSGQILVYDNGTLTNYAATPVSHVVDTTAAGDSFNAGFLAMYLRDMPMETCVRAGADLAAKVVQSRGALIAGT